MTNEMGFLLTVGVIVLCAGIVTAYDLLTRRERRREREGRKSA